MIGSQTYKLLFYLQSKMKSLSLDSREEANSVLFELYFCKYSFTQIQYNTIQQESFSKYYLHLKFKFKFKAAVVVC